MVDSRWSSELNEALSSDTAFERWAPIPMNLDRRRRPASRHRAEQRAPTWLMHRQQLPGAT